MSSSRRTPSAPAAGPIAAPCRSRSRSRAVRSRWSPMASPARRKWRSARMTTWRRCRPQRRRRRATRRRTCWRRCGGGLRRRRRSRSRRRQRLHSAGDAETPPAQGRCQTRVMIGWRPPARLSVGERLGAKLRCGSGAFRPPSRLPSPLPTGSDGHGRCGRGPPTSRRTPSAPRPRRSGRRHGGR